MRSVAFCLMLLAPTANAQPNIDQLKSDLLSLKSLSASRLVDRRYVPWLKDNLDNGQAEVIQRVLMQTIPGYENSDAAWYFAYTLTTVLLSRELPDPQLTILTNSVAQSIAGAIVCADAHTSLLRSDAFGENTEQAYNALLALGVSDANAKSVTRSLIAFGMKITGDVISLRRSGPMVRAIPPAEPPHLLPLN